MEQFIRHGFNAENIPGYDCSIMNVTKKEWFARGDKHVTLGVGFVIYGTITQCLYFLIMSAMWKLKNNNSVYKIMLLLAAFDVAEIGIGSHFSGYLWIVGSSYCAQPNFNYILGCSVLGVWACTCIGSMTLVIHRLTDLWDRSLHDKLFEGKRMYFWLTAPSVYASYFWFFTTPSTFNSTMKTFFYDPFITGTMEEMAQYYNMPAVANNIFIVVVNCTLYGILIIVWRYKYGSQAVTQNTMIQRSITIQSILICSCTLIASFMYTYMMFFVIPNWMILGSHVIWQISHGIPAYVYLIMNKTIRQSVLRNCGLRPGATVTAVTSNQSFTRERQPSVIY